MIVMIETGFVSSYFLFHQYNWQNIADLGCSGMLLVTKESMDFYSFVILHFQFVKPGQSSSMLLVR